MTIAEHGELGPDAVCGVDVLRTCLLHPRDKALQLLRLGHADASGGMQANIELLRMRAQNVMHLLRGERDAWVAQNRRGRSRASRRLEVGTDRAFAVA